MSQTRSREHFILHWGADTDDQPFYSRQETVMLLTRFITVCPTPVLLVITGTTQHPNNVVELKHQIWFIQFFLNVMTVCHQHWYFLILKIIFLTTLSWLEPQMFKILRIWIWINFISFVMSLTRRLTVSKSFVQS